MPVPFIGVVDTAINYGRITLFIGPYVGTVLILNHDGMIEARWDHSASHPRRMVKISGAGREALVDEWQRRPAANLAETGGAS